MCSLVNNDATNGDRVYAGKGSGFGEMWNKKMPFWHIECMSKDKQLEMESGNFGEWSGLELDFGDIIA